MTALSPQATAIYDLVKSNGTGTSFVEIENTLTAAGYDTAGNLVMEHPAVPNLLIWAGVNELFVAALNEVLAAGLAYYRPTSVLVYLADGKMPNFPIAQRPPKNGYREPHWVPAVINVGPAPTD